MITRNSFILAAVILTTLFSCKNEKIETEQSLTTETKNLIKSLGLLNEGESILKFYSNFQKDKAGNFFTTRRIAHYWINDRDNDKNDTTFAFYNDIAYINTRYEVPDTYAPYMTIIKKDSSTFRVYVEGSNQEIKSFFTEAIQTWKKNKD